MTKQTFKTQDEVKAFIDSLPLGTSVMVLEDKDKKTKTIFYIKPKQP